MIWAQVIHRHRRALQRRSSSLWPKCGFLQSQNTWPQVGQFQPQLMQLGGKRRVAHARRCLIAAKLMPHQPRWRRCKCNACLANTKRSSSCERMTPIRIPSRIEGMCHQLSRGSSKGGKVTGTWGVKSWWSRVETRAAVNPPVVAGWVNVRGMNLTPRNCSHHAKSSQDIKTR